jgi:hypothetical protein
MCCPKGKCGCQYFILLPVTLIKKCKKILIIDLNKKKKGGKKEGVCEFYL